MSNSILLEHYPKALSQEWCQEMIKFFDECDEKGWTVRRDDETCVDTQLFFADLADHPEIWDRAKKLNEPYFQALFKALEDYNSKYDLVQHGRRYTVYDIKLKKTAPGEGFVGWHFEDGNVLQSTRKIVFQVYLNTIKHGGTTEYYYQDVKFSPKAGDLLIWPAGFTHTHRGNTVEGNKTKYALTSWLEEIVDEPKSL